MMNVISFLTTTTLLLFATADVVASSLSSLDSSDSNSDNPRSGNLRSSQSTGRGSGSGRDHRDLQVTDQCIEYGDKASSYTSVVYTAIAYEDSPSNLALSSFSSIPLLLKLESDFQSAYNSVIGDCNNDNGYKDLGISFVLASNVTGNQFLIGSQVRSNALSVTCTPSVPMLFGGATAASVAAFTLDNTCVCEGPSENDFIQAYNGLLLQAPDTTSTNTETTIETTAVKQLCLDPICQENTTEITFDAVAGLVRLPCDETVTSSSDTQNPTRSPTRSPTRKPSRSPTRSPTRKPTRKPSKSPTRKPSKSPTKSPTKTPTIIPTPPPTPTIIPTPTPTNPPTNPTTPAPLPPTSAPLPTTTTPAPLPPTPAPLPTTTMMPARRRTTSTNTSTSKKRSLLSTSSFVLPEKMSVDDVDNNADNVII